MTDPTLDRPARRYDCVIFDLDGTLLDTRAAMLAALDTVLAETAHARVAASTLGDSVHFGLGRMLERALSVAKVRETHASFVQLEKRLLTLYRAEAVHRSRPFPNLRALLQTLNERGVWTAICSNQAERSVRTLLDAFALTAQFQRVVGSDTLAACKPDPLPLLWLMEQAGRTPETTLMVGDSAVDAAAAERAGCDCVILAHGYGAPFAGESHLRLPHLAALTDWLGERC